MAVGDRRPGVGLGGGGLGEGTAEPVAGDDAEPPERISGHGGHLAMVPAGTDKPA